MYPVTKVQGPVQKPDKMNERQSGVSGQRVTGGRKETAIMLPRRPKKGSRGRGHDGDRSLGREQLLKVDGVRESG